MTTTTANTDERPAVPPIADLAADLGRLHSRFGSLRAGADPLGAAASLAVGVARMFRDLDGFDGPRRTELTSLARILVVHLHDLAVGTSSRLHRREIPAARNLAAAVAATMLAVLQGEDIALDRCRALVADTDAALDAAQDQPTAVPPRPISVRPDQVVTVYPSSAGVVA